MYKRLTTVKVRIKNRKVGVLKSISLNYLLLLPHLYSNYLRSTTHTRNVHFTRSCTHTESPHITLKRIKPLIFRSFFIVNFHNFSYKFRFFSPHYMSKLPVVSLSCCPLLTPCLSFTHAFLIFISTPHILCLFSC